MGSTSHLWVVAFTDTSLRAEARVAADGRFMLTKLAPGEYGLKVISLPPCGTPRH